MVDPGMRQQIFSKIHQIYLTELPFIVLYSQSFPYIVHEGMYNYQPNLLDVETSNIWEWWCDKGKC